MKRHVTASEISVNRRIGTARRRDAMFQWLTGRFSSERLGNKRDPVDEAIFILLSRRTHEVVYERTFRELKKAFPDWEGLATASFASVERVIADGGFARQRSRQLVALARKLKRSEGAVSLDSVRALTDHDAERYLCGLPGIGSKSAKCILLYSLGRPALPIDIHTYRVARRLRLLGPRHTHPRNIGTQSALERAVPRQYWYAFHVGSVVVGREWCWERAPRCSACPLGTWCPSRTSSRPVMVSAERYPAKQRRAA